MGYIGEKDKKFLKDEFEKKLKEKVLLLVFTDGKCQYCQVTADIASELSELSDLIEYQHHSVDDEIAKKYGVEHAPTVIVTDGDKFGGRIRYVGLPSGYEFSSLIEDIIDVSRRQADIDPEVKEKLMMVDKPLKIQVFVTPTCPYCPKAVRTAHRFAMINENITGEMVEAIEFPALANRWGVMSVPHIVINEDVQFIGAYPDEHYVEYVLQAYKNMK